MAVSVGCISLGNTQQDANQWRCYLAVPTICLPKFLKQFIIIFRAFLTVLINRHFKFILFLLIPCTLYLVTPIAYAAQVTLSWKASEGPVSGYEMHYGTTSGDYDYSVNVGNSTSCNISGLQEGVTYFFAATAHNDIDESDYSDEIAYTIPSSSMTNNILVNGSFEYDSDGDNNPDDWIIAEPVEVDDSEKVDGAYSAKIESTAVINNINRQYVDLEPNTIYTLSAWVKTENVTDGYAQVYPYDYGGVIDTTKWIRVEGTTDWTHFSMQFTTGADPSKARINFRLFNATGTAWFDNINLVESGS